MPKIRAGTLAEHRALTWNSLLDALDALLDERDYESISLSDVATRAGMARNTIYNYIDDKATLLAAAVERSGLSLGEEVERIACDGTQTPSERLSAVVSLLLVSFARGTQRLLLLHDVAATMPAEDQTRAIAPFEVLKSHVVQIVTDGIEADEFGPVRDVDLTFELMAGAMQAAVQHVVREPSAAALTAEAVAPFLLNALRRPSLTTSTTRE